MSQFGYMLLICLCFIGSAAAAPLFEDDRVVEVTVTGPFGSLFADKESRDALPFVLAADDVEHHIAIRLRGHSRLRVCEFPPLRLDFRNSETEATLFAGQGKLKLVTHCRNYDRGEQDLLEEYVAYRILNVLTDLSYRVRLLRISYVDTDGRLEDDATPRYAFALESATALAARTGAEREYRQNGMPKSAEATDAAALMYVFQYLIGNTDWGLLTSEHDETCCHNGTLLRRDSQVLFVPYDFDMAGLVNARYAAPNPYLSIDRVTQRLYRGVCVERETLRRAVQKVSSAREDILDVLRATPGLSAANKANAENYLDAFFNRTAREDRLLRSFERRCL